MTPLVAAFALAVAVEVVAVDCLPLLNDDDKGDASLSLLAELLEVELPAVVLLNDIVLEDCMLLGKSTAVAENPYLNLGTRRVSVGIRTRFGRAAPSST
jgi:hypothetical protein